MRPAHQSTSGGSRLQPPSTRGAPLVWAFCKPAPLHSRLNKRAPLSVPARAAEPSWAFRASLPPRTKSLVRSALCRGVLGRERYRQRPVGQHRVAGAISAPPAYSISGNRRRICRVNRFICIWAIRLPRRRWRPWPKARCLSALARNIETVRIKENRRVAVGGCVIHDHLLARGDPLATEHPTVALVPFPFPVRSPQPRRSVTAQARVLTHLQETPN